MNDKNPNLLPSMVFLAFFLLGSTAPVEAAPASCDALDRADFSTITDAPTQITQVTLVPEEGGLPAYCRVKGYVGRSVGMEMALPLSSWNGKFLQVGCGGFCGEIHLQSCNPALRRGYACLATDMGHKSTMADSLWSYNNLPAKIDHAYRATHVATLAGKAIAESFYKTAPRRSYFMGCSTGGRQALVEAQRFPTDYDGIVAGAPSISVSSVGIGMLWSFQALTDQNRLPLLSRGDLQLAHQAALDQCDELGDGIRDGIIGDPFSCKLDLSRLACNGARNSRCLTQKQIDALSKAYAGPVTSTGKPLTAGGALPGSELNMISSDSSPKNVAALYNFIAHIFRYNVFDNDPGPAWQFNDFDYDRDHKRMGAMEILYGAANPDMREFKAAGGKIIAYVGLNDHMQARMVTDYYRVAEKAMGGRTSTQDFFRLFAVPGMDHCSGGDGASAVDYLSYLEAWVERGQAPDQVLAAHVTNPDSEARGSLEFPLPAEQVDFTRPIYPYPVVTRYKGSGDSNDADSFGPAGIFGKSEKTSD